MYATKTTNYITSAQNLDRGSSSRSFFHDEKKNRTFNQNEMLHLNFDIVLMRAGGLIAQESVILIIFSGNSKITNNIISVIKIKPKKNSTK